MTTGIHALIMLLTGGMAVFVHDFAYRRVDTGEGQYEFGGLISHAGADMIVVTIILTLVSLAISLWKGN